MPDILTWSFGCKTISTFRRRGAPGRADAGRALGGRNEVRGRVTDPFDSLCI